MHSLGSSPLLPILIGLLAVGAAGLVLVLLAVERNRLRKARAAADYTANRAWAEADKA